MYTDFVGQSAASATKTCKMKDSMMTFDECVAKAEELSNLCTLQEVMHKGIGNSACYCSMDVASQPEIEKEYSENGASGTS